MSLFRSALLSLTAALATGSATIAETSRDRTAEPRVSPARCEMYVKDPTAPGQCMSVKEWCRDECVAQWEVEWIRCAAWGPTSMAVVCHGENAFRLGACMKQCAQL
jgi:hypothetical protein